MKFSIKSLFLFSLIFSTQAFADVTFYCSGDNEEHSVLNEMHSYFKELGIQSDWVNEIEEPFTDNVKFNLYSVTYSLKKKSNNLLLKDNPLYGIHNDIIQLPLNHSSYKTLSIVSKKEILLALLQPGRNLVIVNSNDNKGSQSKNKSEDCSIEKLKDHIGIRQNTVAWASDLEWQWPDGDVAQWNKTYWRKGTPNKKYSLVQSFNDIFFQQKLYGIGCYTATKIVMIQGILDYYARIKKDPIMVKKIETALWQGREPLEDIEPPVMWKFEDGYNNNNDNLPGKILSIAYVSAENFIPGDWGYMLNTDPITYQKTGYEGSNAIYLGQNLFDDYYNDNNHSYTYHEKLNEVYQWRHHVFSHRRDKDKIEALSFEQLDKLGQTPKNGGLLLEEKIFPNIF